MPRIAFDLIEEVHPQADRFGDVLLMYASGEVDFATGPQLRERLFAHIGHAQMLVLDLSAVTFIDSMAIGVLVGAATRMQEVGTGTLSVVCSSENERVLRIFDIVGVASLITLHRTTKDALAAPASAAREQQSGSPAQAAAVRASAVGASPRQDTARQYSPAQASRQTALRTTPDAVPHRVDRLA